MDVRKLCKQGHLEEAVRILDFIAEADIQDPLSTYIYILKECIRVKSLAQGKKVHAQIKKSGFVSNIIIENTLVDMYGKCGSLLDAHQTFEKMQNHNVFSWTAIISAYTKEGQGHEAIGLFQQMRYAGVAPDKFIFVIVLKACGSVKALEQGRQIHADIINSGIELDNFVWSTLADAYAKCGCIEDARQVFNNSSVKDVVSWNAMLSGYAQQGLAKEANTLFEAMQREGLKPNEITFASIVKACAILGNLECGKLLHSNTIRCGFELNAFVGNSILDMYIKCCCIEDAWKVFNKLHDLNVVSWTVMIAGCAQQGLWRTALTLFKEMQQKGFNPNAATFVSALKACAGEESLEQGRQLHAQITESDIEVDAFVGSSLVDMYAKCGSVEDARHLFTVLPNQDVVLWNAIIVGYAQQGLGDEALALFAQMQQLDINPVDITFVCVLKACAGIAALEEGKLLHAQTVKRGLETNEFVGSTLVDMYAKCENIEDAHHVFSKIDEHDVVSWNTMVAACTQHGLDEDAVTLFEQMKSEGVTPNVATFVNILKAYGGLAVLDWGKELHSELFERGIESSMYVRSALLDMYAKCGSLEEACEIFNAMERRDVVTWTAIITAYAQQGLGQKALALFDEMQQEGVKPNEITFISVLSGCSHAGLLEESHLCFALMNGVYGIAPTTDHYACMIDLLGRAGYLVEAYGFVKAMPAQAGEVVWTALLSACSIYGTVELAEQVIQEVLKINPQNAAAYVQLSNIYAMNQTHL